MSPLVSPFIPRVFSKPTEEELVQMGHTSCLMKEDNDARRREKGLVFTAPVAKILLAPSTSHKTGSLIPISISSSTDNRLPVESKIPHKDQCDESGEGPGAHSILVARPNGLLFRADSPNADSLGLAAKTDKFVIPWGTGPKRSCGALVSSYHDPRTEQGSLDAVNTLAPGDDFDSDLEWDQPGAFNFLADIETDDVEVSDNDTRSSGYTELSPLRPRRLFETTLLNRAARGCSSLCESALWGDNEDTGPDLSSIADANDLSQYHADLEDELDGIDTDADDSDDEYSSACSTLAASDESGDDDFFDAKSDTEHSEESIF